MSLMSMAAILGLIELEIAPFDPLYVASRGKKNPYSYNRFITLPNVCRIFSDPLIVYEIDPVISS